MSEASLQLRKGCRPKARQNHSIASENSRYTLPFNISAHGNRADTIQLDDRVFIVTGGARGLGLTLAEALVEAGGHGLHYLPDMPRLRTAKLTESQYTA